MGVLLLTQTIQEGASSSKDFSLIPFSPSFFYFYLWSGL